MKLEGELKSESDCDDVTMMSSYLTTHNSQLTHYILLFVWLFSCSSSLIVPMMQFYMFFRFYGCSVLLVVPILILYLASVNIVTSYITLHLNFYPLIHWPTLTRLILTVENSASLVLFQCLWICLSSPYLPFFFSYLIGFAICHLLVENVKILNIILTIVW